MSAQMHALSCAHIAGEDLQNKSLPIVLLVLCPDGSTYLRTPPMTCLDKIICKVRSNNPA